MNVLLAVLLREKLVSAGLSSKHTVGSALEAVQAYIGLGGDYRHTMAQLLIAETALQVALAAGVPDNASLTD